MRRKDAIDKGPGVKTIPIMEPAFTSLALCLSEGCAVHVAQ